MTISGLSALLSPMSNAHTAQSQGQHKFGHAAPSLADIEAVGSQAASAPSAAAKVGSKIDILA